MKPEFTRSLENETPARAILTFTLVTKAVISMYVLSLAYSQWYFAGIQEGTLRSIVPKNLTSILFISILIVLVTLVERFSEGHSFSKFPVSNMLILVSYFFLFSTFLSLVIGVWRSGLSFDTVEGIKSLAGTLCGILLVRHFSKDVRFYLRLYAYVFGSIVIFGLIQLSIGVNWTTRNSFFTVGAEARWWELSSAWGPFALSGKNVFGVILVLSFSLLAPLTLLTKFFTRFDRIFVGAVLVADIVLIFMSKSRSSIVLLLLNLFILLIFYTLYSKNPIPITFTFLITPIFGGFFLANNSTWILSTQSAIARGNSLSAALLSPNSDFFFGTGYNSIFQLTSSTIGNSLTQAGTRGINIDNYFARRALEGGFLGLISFFAIMVCLVSLFVIKEQFGKQGRVWGICAILLFIDITIASALGDFLSFQLVNCYFFLIIGLIAGGLRSSGK